MRYNGLAAIIKADLAASHKIYTRPLHLKLKQAPTLLNTKALPLITRRSITYTCARYAESTGSAPVTNSPSNADALNAGEHDDPSSEGSSRGGHPRSPLQSPETMQAFFKDLMRTVPHPVAVVTARRQDIEDDVQGTFAATVSSFNTVSFNPDLVVSFNLKSNSITYQTIRETQYFTVTFPQMTSAGAELVDCFTKGNDRSPFLTETSDRLAPVPFRWLFEEHPSAPLSVKYHPPAVCFGDPNISQSSGFAFAFLCEYQTSTPVGDHVIVTGRLTPTPMKTTAAGWGAMNSDAPFATNYVTLAHVHGIYSNSDTGLGFANLWRLDDVPPEKLVKSRNSTALADWYKKRLKIIGLAQQAHLGGQLDLTSGEKLKGKAPWVTRAMRMTPEVLEKYKEHYTERMNYWEILHDKGKLRTKATSSQPLQKHSDPVDVGSIQQLEAKPPSSSEPDSAVSIQQVEAQTTSSEPESAVRSIADIPFSQLRGSQKLLVKNKMLLSAKELKEEITMYRKRLSTLSSGQEIRTSLQVPPEDEITSREEQLKEYFEERIQLLQHAQTLKADNSSTAESVEDFATAEKTGRNQKRYLGALRQEGLASLKNKYRRYQQQLTEARLCLMGLEALPETNQEVKTLNSRIRYFEPRLAMVARVIQERVKQSPEHAADLKQEFKLPTIRPPEPTDVKSSTASRRNRDTYTKGNPIGSKRLDLKAIAATARHEGIPSAVGESADQLDFEQQDHTPNERSGVHDYIVMKHFEEEVIPTLDDMVDTNKIRLEREAGKHDRKEPATPKDKQPSSS